MNASVTEIRNALRCPRVFALGRLRGRQVAFPLGASALGSAFHRIVEAFARAVDGPPPQVLDLAPGCATEAIEAALSRWILELGARELETDPGYASMPAEVDDLAEALRQLAAYLAARIAKGDEPPRRAIAALVAEAEVGLETTVELDGGEVAVVTGRIDALYAPRDARAEVVEYKLTHDSNEELDRAQVALYRFLLSRSRDLDAVPVILRFNPGLTITQLARETADALVAGRLVPLLGRMSAWVERPGSAPATDRTDLCPACPVRAECREVYAEHLTSRDDPPSNAARPRPAPQGGLRPAAMPEPMAPRRERRDEEGREEAEGLRSKIVGILRQQGVGSPHAKPPVVGARIIQVEVSVAAGSIGRIDRAAKDVVHRLAAEDGVTAAYEKKGGLRFFRAERRRPRTVVLSDLIADRADWLRERPGRFVIGEAVDGEVVCGDLSDPSSCHLLVGGATGSGKSVLLRSIVTSLAHFHPPSAVRFTLIDPKRVSFGRLAVGLAAHLSGPVCHDVAETLPVLEGLVEQMEDRYRILEEEAVQSVVELEEVRQGRERIPLEVVVVDEFQDLVASKETREPFIALVRRLGAKARAAGIHLVLATQRPTRDSVPGSIKANLPGKIALKTASGLESRIILDQAGAESLLGKGDLLADLGSWPVRGQAPIA
ncbi:MAG: PD-(D/E)XK nuclease family protein [Deltaproteobacteria bacterium]|nr:PD-(D/E)XK nuclease family protein [Deltaproteobacteria bacterium]